MITFKDPWILLTIIPAAIVLFVFLRAHKDPAFRFSSVQLFSGLPVSLKARLSRGLLLARVIAVVLFLIALAGPRRTLDEAQYRSEGMDIVLAIDISGSMAAEDFRVQGKRKNRLDVVKSVAAEFIEARTDDRLALVAFSGLAYTACPLTLDQGWLLTSLEQLELGLIEDGTAIGSGLASSISRLKDSQAKSKVIILLTDGVNNAGKIDPVVAARMAEALNIKVYTIGVGSKGPVPFPVKDLWGRTVYQNVTIELDDQLLDEIAAITGGRYFEAMETEALRAIYQEIDRLEKTDIEQTGYKEYQQLFPLFLLAGLLILLVEIILSRTFFLKVP